MSSPQPIEVFISYAHKDEKWRDELAKHLILLEEEGIIKTWYDRNISGGTEWEPEILDHLNSARMILLLISSDFLGSKFCYSQEMTRAMTRHELKEARVIPIILRKCNWHTAPFGKLQALPKDAKPVKNWGDHDGAFASVETGIRKVAEELRRHP